MRRREFLNTSLMAGAVAAVQKSPSAEHSCFYEWIRFQVLTRPKVSPLENYLKTAVIPALNRLGIEPVGVFKAVYGSNNLEVFVLIPHQDLKSFVTVWDKMLEDKEYVEKGAEFLNTDINNPLYYRFETSLLKAFSHMPKPEIPPHIKGKSSRIFEVRTYESHNRQKGKLKIEMFNEGGEIAIFRETGLTPVFFAETLAGPKMPNLMYMVGFENMEDRDKRWESFRNSPGWQTLSKLPRYADTVSGITDIILSASSCSQI